MTKYTNRLLTYSTTETMTSLSKDQLFEFYAGVKNLGIKFNNETSLTLAELEISPIIDLSKEFSYNIKEKFTKTQFEKSYIWKEKDWGAIKDILASNIVEDKVFHFEMTYEILFYRDKPYYKPGFENWEHKDFVMYENNDYSFTEKFYSLELPFWKTVNAKKHHKYAGVPEWGDDNPKYKKWLKINGFDEETQLEALQSGVFALPVGVNTPSDYEIEKIELTDEEVKEWNDFKEKKKEKDLKDIQKKREEFHKKNLDTWQE